MVIRDHCERSTTKRFCAKAAQQSLYVSAKNAARSFHQEPLSAAQMAHGTPDEPWWNVRQHQGLEASEGSPRFHPRPAPPVPWSTQQTPGLPTPVSERRHGPARRDAAAAKATAKDTRTTCLAKKLAGIGDRGDVQL